MGEGVMIYINVETGNAAFEDAGELNELARILRGAADRIEGGDMDFPLSDYNGNRVGEVSEEPKPERNLRIRLETDNAAFAEDHLPYEAARIIRKAADSLESGRRDFGLMDINGNTVGKVQVVTEPSASLDDSPSP